MLGGDFVSQNSLAIPDVPDKIDSVPSNLFGYSSQSMETRKPQYVALDLQEETSNSTLVPSRDSFSESGQYGEITHSNRWTKL